VEASPVRLGSILFTLVEPHRGHEVAYNRWYERDHFYAGCMVGPGILAGARFVATRRHKALRSPPASAITADPSRGSYLALYWISREGQDAWGAWAAQEVHRLHRAGRMFPHRDHVHTRMYRYRGGAFRDPDGVPAEIALDHRYPGLVVTFVEAPPGERDACLRGLLEEHLPGRLAGSPAAMALAFTPVPVPDDAPVDIPRPVGEEGWILLLWFVERDPAEGWEGSFAGAGSALEGTGRLRHLFTGPFVATIPGTDAYVDELW
jgi:hypothetical protein